MRFIKAMVVLAAVCAFPAVALAHKKPTKSQSKALVRATDSYLHRQIPGGCLREVISTPDTSWAEVGFAPGPNHNLPVICAKFAADGVILFHFHAGHWHFKGAGSDFRNGNGGCALTKTVPHKVIADFKLC